MAYSIALLQLMAQAGAYARRPVDLIGYVVRCGEHRHDYPVEDFEDLISHRFVEKLDAGDWVITDAGRVQAQRDEQIHG